MMLTRETRLHNPAPHRTLLEDTHLPNKFSRNNLNDLLKDKSTSASKGIHGLAAMGPVSYSKDQSRKKSSSNRHADYQLLFDNNNADHPGPSDQKKHIRTQVQSIVNKRSNNLAQSKRSPDDFNSTMKASELLLGNLQKKTSNNSNSGNNNNYFLTADVTNVLRAINLSSNGNNNQLGASLKKHQQQNIQNNTNGHKKATNMMTEEDVQRLFNEAPKKKRSEIRGKENMEFTMGSKPTKKKTVCDMESSLKNPRKKDLKTETNDDFCNRKMETMNINFREIMNNDENGQQNPVQERLNTQTGGYLRDSRKDLAESVKFLELNSDEPQTDKLLSGLAETGLIKIEEDPTIDKTTKFKSEFLVGKQIGEGAYASVRLAVYKPTNQKVAIKIYQKKKIKETPRKRSVRREIKILQRLNHNNIMKIYDVIETNNHVNIIMQFISGISLNSFLKTQPDSRANEKDARRIFRGLVDAVKYLHSMQISHRDIKLQNVLLDSKLNPKLIDFGFSTCLQEEEKVKLFCGTPSYMSPEIVLKTEYRGEPADIWALGVLLYVILTGNFPFKGQTDKELYRKIANSEYPRMEGVSRSAANLIALMLTIDPEERITADEILEHEWLNPNTRREGTSSKIVAKEESNNGMTIYEKFEALMLLNKSGEKSRAKQFKQQNKALLAETLKQNLRHQLRLANDCDTNIGANGWSPKATKHPRTCTNRQITQKIAAALAEGETKNTLINNFNERVNLAKVEEKKTEVEKAKKSQERLTNKRYF